MKLVVTGGAGFIGSCLVWKLNKEGISEIIIVDDLGKSDKWKNLVGKKFSDYIEKDDFLELIEKRKLDTKIDMVVHFGACSSTTEPDASFLLRNNYEYSKKLAKWAIGQNVPFLYASSAATYGSGNMGYCDRDEVTLELTPLNMYGYSKHLFDLWVIGNRLSGKITGFKFFNVFGPNEYHKGEMTSVIGKSFDKVVKEKKIKLFKSYRREYADGEQKRDFIYVKDALEIVYYFITHPDKKGIYNVGTGHARTWNELAYALFSAIGIKPRIEYIDMPHEIKERYQYFTQADLAKLRSSGCSYECTDINLSVKDYVGFLKGHSYL